MDYAHAGPMLGAHPRSTSDMCVCICSLHFLKANPHKQGMFNLEREAQPFCRPCKWVIRVVWTQSHRQMALCCASWCTYQAVHVAPKAFTFVCTAPDTAAQSSANCAHSSMLAAALSPAPAYAQASML